MADVKVLHLQLFADGGEGGGEGAATGENAADAGQSRLLELGVPAEKIRNRAKKAQTPVPEGAIRKPEGQDAAAKAAEEAGKAPEESAKPAYVWDEIKDDPGIQEKMSEVIRARVSKESDARKAAEEKLSHVDAAAEVLAKRYKLDRENPDFYKDLAKAIENDGQFYEERAIELGVSVETAMKIDQSERAEARRQREEARTLEQEAISRHIQSLEQQGEALKQVFPNFDLRAELQNQTFARLTAPSSGLTLEDAYYAVHRKEIQAAANKVTAQRTAEAISQSIQAGQRRPDENGSSSQGASVTTFDYSKASKEQREALKREIRAAAARGEKLYPR